MSGSLRSIAVTLALAGALVLAGAGSGGATQRSGPAAAAQKTARTSVYFLFDRGTAAIGVRRTIRPNPESARAALQTLLAGPTAAEAGRGITTAIPRGVRIRSFAIKQGARSSEAIVDLAGLPPVKQTSAVTKVRVITQVTRTLVGLSDVGRVRLHGDGRPWGLQTHAGTIPDAEHSYAELLGFYQICASKAGTETVLADCFTALP
jgi:spore germination protein GerM